MTWNTKLDSGGVLVSDKITLEFELSLIKNVAEAAPAESADTTAQDEAPTRAPESENQDPAEATAPAAESQPRRPQRP